MGNLIRGEFYKLRKSKYSIGMILLALLAGFFIFIQFRQAGEINQLRQSDPVNGVYALTYVFLNIIFEGNFIFVLLCTEFIIKDFKSSCINKSFTYGYKRNQVLLSKIVVLMIFFLILEIIYGSILVIYVSQKYGFCDVFNLNTILYLFRVIILGIMYNLATVSIILMIAIITKSNFCTLISPLVLIMIFIFDYVIERYAIGRAIFYLPYMSGMVAMVNSIPKINIVICITSSIVTFIITIGGSLLYVKHEDIK
ncbi:hypothetical protein ACP49_00360 [Clostridium botulinum]|uniref:ABC transporter permease n=1 Tax=Clostridium botulinum TaxID=1491 RepID=UPI0005F96707|nr:ABC transporter permease [Clostridium botulinum]KOM95860.1 hypothetical protein ACP53_15075 [Clostridium botulinum]KON02149.1 hypothetical protein ACP49_00360 [Clostridium botulinum]MBY7005567.1 ABC transporter permease [Clostridium botulinum]MCC5438708.1 ABC transporter permease [Clostridium botulinum]MCR1148184.1 ABC transporter permease [Clostridium botulinum]